MIGDLFLFCEILFVVILLLVGCSLGWGAVDVLLDVDVVVGVNVGCGEVGVGMLW